MPEDMGLWEYLWRPHQVLFLNLHLFKLLNSHVPRRAWFLFLSMFSLCMFVSLDMILQLEGRRGGGGGAHTTGLEIVTVT